MKKADDDLQTITVKFPKTLLAKIDAWMKRKGVIKRSDGIRMLISRGLDLDRPSKTVPPDVQALIDLVEEDRREIEEGSPGKPVTLVDAYERMRQKREEELEAPAEPSAKKGRLRAGLEKLAGK